MESTKSNPKDPDTVKRWFLIKVGDIPGEWPVHISRADASIRYPGCPLRGTFDNAVDCLIAASY